MLFVLYLLLHGAANATASVPIGPAPGARPLKVVPLAGGEAALDPDGRGFIPESAGSSLAGLRCYRSIADPKAKVAAKIFYYATDEALVTASMHASASEASAEILMKDHASGWEGAMAIRAPVEPDGAASRLRFVLRPGRWDVAILVPGSAPELVLRLDAKGEPLALGELKLRPAGRVKARILDAHSRRAPERWNGYVSRVGGDPKTEEARFFAGWPVARDGDVLDFQSLPVGAWELRVESPGRGRSRKPVNVSAPGALVDVGDLFLSAFGGLRVVLQFPADVPPGAFDIELNRSGTRRDEPSNVLGLRSVRPKGETVVEFAEIEPGEVDVKCQNADAHLFREDSVVVEPDRIAESRIVMRPIDLHGTVRRGESAVPGAAVSSPPGRNGLGEPKPAISDALGAYELRVWGGEGTIFLTTLPPGEATPFAEFVAVDPEAAELDHDVLLPANEIRGVVRDAATGAPLEGAKVDFTTALTDREPGEDATSFDLAQSTDREGRFRLANLTDHPVDVGVTLEGYSPAKLPSVRPAAVGADLDIRLEKGSRLSGTVVDEAGEPVSGATVGLDVNPQGYFFERTATADGAGRYEFAGVSDGAHTLGLIPCGHTIVLHGFVLDPADSSRSGGHVEDLRLRPESLPLTVRFESGDGSPARKTMFRWAIDGMILPSAAWYEAVQQCGYSDAPADDRIVLHGFPVGTITALSFHSQQTYGTFVNDGSEPIWTIRLPPSDGESAPKRAAK